MMTSHGVVQGYNRQALIDGKHQVIVHGEAFGDGQDHGHVPPMLTGALENLQSLAHEPDYFKEKILTADSNYHTQVNLKECQELGWMPIFLIGSSATGTRGSPPRSGARCEDLPYTTFIMMRPWTGISALTVRS